MLSNIPEWWLRCSALLLLCCSSLNLVVVAQNDICTGLRRGYGDSGTTTFPIDMARVGTALSKVSPGSTFGTESNTQVTAMFSICTFLVSCPSVCANCSSMMIRTADAITYTSTNNTCSNVVYFGNAPEFISPPTAPLVSATLMLQYTSGSTTPDHTLYIGLMCDSSIPEHSAPTIDALGFFDVTTVVVQVHHSSFCPETKTVPLNLTHSWGVFTQTREKITATHKRERTASAALTASDPLTPSHALPHTKSVPITNSGALTPSFAGRLSRTASMMLTLTRDKNTKSAPVTLSVSTSSSRSATRTPPPVPTPSATHSMTRTRPSATQSVTRSNIVTGTRPLTMTKSLRVSTTASVTHSNTVTDSESLPHTKSPVPTVSHSVSLTASVTSSLTSTLSRTHIVTASKNTMSTSQALSATTTHERTPTRSINMSHSTSSSFDVTATTTLFPTPSPTVSLRITPSDSTTVTSSATISVSATLTVIPATNVSIKIGENATVYLGSAVPLPILQRVTLQINTEGSSVLQAVAGMALTFSLTTPASSGTSTINAFPPYSPRQINIVAVLSLTPELLPSYTPEAYGSILPVAMCVMLSQRSLANPFIMVMVTVLLNTTTGGIISGGTGINQLKMPQNVPTDNVPDSYGGYALYQLVFPSNAAPVVLLIRPTTLVFLAASMLSNPETPVFSAPSQVIVFNVAPYSVTAPLPYTTLTRLLTMQSTETYVIVYTRDGTDVCARAVGGISGSGVVNITTNMIPFQLIDNDTNKVHAQLVQGNCIRLGNAATGDYINSIVSDFDEGAAEDGWLGSAAHKTVLVPPAVKPLPSFVFRTSVSCTVAAIQLIKVTNGTSGVTLPTYTMLVGDLVAFTACSSTAPVVLSSRIFGSPVDNVDFPFALMVWGGALSLVNTSGGEILATILAPGNSTDQTLLLPFWMPPVDSPVPTPVLETGIQRLPFLMVRNNLLELVELQTVVQSGSKSNVTLILKEIITEDINRHIQAVALLPPFSYDVTNTSSFEGVALISVEPNMVITALLRPSKKALNRSGDDAPPLIHYRQQLVLPSIELDYVLSIKRWNRQATQTKGSSTLIYGNCSFITDLVPRRDGGDVFQTVQGEVFQLNTLRMSFLICVDHTYGIIEVISDMTASPSGVAGGVMRFTTPSYILSAHQQEFTVVSLGQSFYAALTKNGSTAGVSWHAYNPYLQFQSSSLVSPHRAKASNYTTPLPSNGLILSKYYQIELYALKVTGSVLVVRDIVNGGVNVWDYFLGMTCNQSSEFLVIDSAVDATVLGGGITAVSFVCLHDYIPSAFEPSIMISPITILLNASVYDGINRFTHRPTVVLVGSLQKFLGYVPPAYAFVNSGNYQYPEVNLIQFAVVACVASGPPSNVTTVCRIVLAIMGTEILLITPQLSTTQTPAGNWYTVVTGTVSTVYQAIGMQLSQRSSVAYVLSSEGITAFDTMSGAMLWVSNTVSVCRPAQEPLEFSPSNTPCHIEVMDELCDYGGACSVILVGYDNNGLPNILGFDSRGNVGSVPSGAIASVDPSWTFLPANISWSALGTVAFLAELLAPTQKWNSKVYLFSAANLSITCYSVRDTNSSLTELWTAAIVSNDVDSDSTVFSFLTEVLDNARGTGRNPCFGLLRVSDFGIVVALLRCSMPFQEESTGVWRVATYSVMVGLDALTGQLLWEVEPLTYDVLAVTTAGNTIIHQPRSFLADEDRGYVVWNATIMLAQISASPYFFNGSDNASDPWFHSQIEEERNIVGIDVLNGTLLFQIPIPRPSNASSENEYGASANHFSHIPGTVPSPSALLLSLVPLSSILVITEYASRTTWATDVALFPLGHRITEVQEFYIEHLPSMDAFYLFGTLDIMLDSWRPTAALADWECTNLIPYSQLGLQDLGAGAVSLAVETEGCNASKRLTGILNWTALPRPFDNWWQAQQASRIANNAPLLGSVSTLSVPGQSIAGNFDFALLRHTGIVNLDVSSNELAGVLTSFDGLPTTVEFVNLSNQALYAGTQLPGAAASKLFTSIESLSYLQEATFLQSLDLSKNILSASISRDFLLYVPPSLRFLNLSDTNLFGQLFDFTRPVDNASSSHSFVAEPKTPREFNAVWKAILGRNASGSGLSVIDVSHNFFEDDPTTSRLMSAFCSDLYIPSITAMFLQNNRIASVAPPNFYNINTTNASDVTTFVNQCRLTYVDFSHNNISGALDFTSIAKTLLTLNLSHNDLRDVVDLTDLPTLWHANLSTLDVTFNPMLAGVLSPQCPPISPKLYYDPTQMPCMENNGGSSNTLYTEAICSDTRQSSMILPYLDPDSGHAVPGRLTMYYTQNQTADPSTETYLTNCSFDTSSLLRFADGRIGYLDLFVYDTAACLPRNMLILDAYIDLASTNQQSQSNAGAPTPNASMVIANISIRFFRNASDTANITLASVATVLPDADTPIYWSNFTNSSCNYLGGSYCMLDTDSTPYRLEASASTGVALFQYGGYSQTILTTHVCYYNATVMVLPVALGGSALFPNRALLEPLVNCLPSTLGAYVAITTDGSNQIEIQDTTPVPAQFEAQICDHLPSPTNCPAMPHFTPPTSIAEAELAETCVDGFCADVKSIMWQPCGTSIWNYDGFHGVGECIPLSDILRLPMTTLKDPSPPACVYESDPPTCSQYAGRWTSFGVNLLLQAIQPDFYNNSLIQTYKENCDPEHPPLCANPNNNTIAPTLNETDDRVFCYLLELLSQPTSQIMVTGYCDNAGQSVFLTTCGDGPHIPILQLNSSTCLNGIQAFCSACMPYIEPKATSLPYTFMIISSLKDIVFILLGAYFLSKVWFRRPVTMCLTRMLLSITPLNQREKQKYAEVLMARFNPLIIAPGQLYDVCDELLIRDDARRQEYSRRKNDSFGHGGGLDGDALPDGHLYDEGGGSAGGNSSRNNKSDKVSLGSSHRSWREELTLENFLRTIGFRKNTQKDMSLNAETTTEGSGGGGQIVSDRSNNNGGQITSRRSNLSEPILRETAGALPIDKEHPLEQHSSTLFSEEGVLVDDNVDSEVLQHFYRYYREAVCEHSRRQIGNVNHPLVRQRFQRLFEVYTEMFHKSQFGRERLMSNVFLDIQEDELQVDVSQNFYSSFAVTSRSLNTENTRMSTTASRLHHRRHAASSAGRHNSGAQGSNSVFSVHSGHGSDAMPYSSMQLGRSAANRFSSVPPSTRRSAMHELTESFVRDRDAGAAGSPMSMAGGARIRNSMGEEMMPIAAPVSDKEIKILEALEDELQLAKEELFEVTEMVPILLVPTMVDARFTPQAWMLFLEGAYCVLYFLICVYESSTVPGYGGWLVYNSVYFRYVNSCSSVGLVVNALLRRVYLDEPILAYDPFIVTALALMGPAIFSHIIPGIVLYAWIHALVLIVWLPCCWIMRQLEKRFFYTLDPISILFRVCFRLGTTIVATLLLQSSYNWALLFYMKRDSLGYLGILEYEYDSRTWSCLIESYLTNLANVVQFLSAFV